MSVLIAVLQMAYLVNIDVRGYNIKYLDGTVVDSIRCHHRMKEPLMKALKCVKTFEMHYGETLIDNYGGCYNYRNTANTNNLSKHASGLAIDINVPKNGSRYINLQHPVLVNCFKSQGFTWGGDFNNKDYMHFELRTDYTKENLIDGQ